MARLPSIFSLKKEPYVGFYVGISTQVSIKSPRVLYLKESYHTYHQLTLFPLVASFTRYEGLQGYEFKETSIFNPMDYDDI